MAQRHQHRTRQPRSFAATIRGYLIVAIVFFAYLASIGVVVVIERFVLGLVQ